MSGTRVKQAIRRGVLVAAFTVLAVPVVGVGSATAHGYTNSPTSRALFCQQGVVQNCGDIQWEPQSVEGPKGFPALGPSDGTICAGGNSRFAPLDDPRGGSWPTTNVRGGQSYTFRWHLTARHSTTSFRYFVTRDGWNPGQPLTRSALESTPLLTVPGNNQQPPADPAHTATLPNKSGRHLILSVWDIADTANAFYQCADVHFG